jgi:2-iminobutanoate/2-iminopropanoate deaminase
MRTILAIVVLVVGIAIGLVSAQALQKINPPGLSTPQTYTHIVRAGNLVFIAGQVGSDAQGKLAGPGMREQTEQVLKNLQTALASQKLDFGHVAKITIFTTSVDEFRAQDVAAIRAKYFGSARPASTLVQISQLASPDLKVEIEAVAVVP